jgi:class 3 adenylate cyclase
VWVGRAANFAAKLTSLPDGHASRITADVYRRLHDSLKVSNGKAIWEAVKWTDMDNYSIYRSTWWWEVA